MARAAYEAAADWPVVQLLLSDDARLVGTRTGYDALHERIVKTGEKKAALLAVLRHAEVPLHNNDSASGARGGGGA